MPPEPSPRQRATTTFAWLLDVCITLLGSIVVAALVALVTPFGFAAVAQVVIYAGILGAWLRNHKARCRLQDAWEAVIGRLELLDQENATLARENRKLAGENDVLSEVLAETIADETKAKDS